MRTVTKREMLLAVGIASVILMFWGIFGTRNKNRISAQKEQKNVIENEKSLSSAGSREEESSAKKYDAALYLRAKPLRDPFQAAMNDVKKPEQNSSSIKQVPTGNTEKEIIAKPVLQGIICFNNTYLAMMEFHGESFTVRRGDRMGEWIVTSIQKKSVELSGNGEKRTLALTS